MVSYIAKINDRARQDKNAKIYTSKKLLLKKGSYPSEASLMNGIVFSVLNSDEIYHNLTGQCLVIMAPDSPDSDDLVLYLVL
jgi:hypothetical protein